MILGKIELNVERHLVFSLAKRLEHSYQDADNNNTQQLFHTSRVLERHWTKPKRQ